MVTFDERRLATRPCEFRVGPPLSLAESVSYGGAALQRLLQEDFTTVLDIGCGPGQHHREFERHGKLSTPVDIIPNENIPGLVVGDYSDLKFPTQFDAVWACHVLEHQLNVHDFMKKVASDTREGGWIAITVPPLKHHIVGGHLSLWNCGLLLYHMLLAGLDCRQIMLKTYGYNCSAIVRKESFEVPFEDLTWGPDDFDVLRPWIPHWVKHSFDGDIKEINWSRPD